MTRLRISLIIVLAVSLLIPLTPMNAGAEKVLKVGIMAPLTGPAALTGMNMKYALMMKLDEVGWQVGDYNLN